MGTRQDTGRALRVVALIAVAVGLLLITGAACVLSYPSVHALAGQAGASASLARIYPVSADVLLVVSGCGVLALRGAGLPSRLFGWSCLILLLAGLVAAGAVHAAGIVPPRQPAQIAAAILPWLLVIVGFGLLLTLLRHARLRWGAAVAEPRATRPVLPAPVLPAPVLPAPVLPAPVLPTPVLPAPPPPPPPASQAPPWPAVPALAVPAQAGGHHEAAHHEAAHDEAAQPEPAKPPAPPADLQFRARIAQPGDEPEPAKAPPAPGTAIMPPPGPLPPVDTTKVMGEPAGPADELSAAPTFEEGGAAAPRPVPPALRRQHSTPTPPGE